MDKFIEKLHNSTYKEILTNMDHPLLWCLFLAYFKFCIDTALKWGEECDG